VTCQSSNHGYDTWVLGHDTKKKIVGTWIEYISVLHRHQINNLILISWRYHNFASAISV
jgi:hypothetical protein